MPRVLMLAVLLLPGCTMAEVASGVADLRWHVAETFRYSAPPPVPAYSVNAPGEAAGTLAD